MRTKAREDARLTHSFSATYIRNPTDTIVSYRCCPTRYLLQGTMSVTKTQWGCPEVGMLQVDYQTGTTKPRTNTDFESCPFRDDYTLRTVFDTSFISTESQSESTVSRVGKTKAECSEHSYVGFADDHRTSGRNRREVSADKFRPRAFTNLCSIEQRRRLGLEASAHLRMHGFYHCLGSLTMQNRSHAASEPSSATQSIFLRISKPIRS